MALSILALLAGACAGRAGSGPGGVELGTIRGTVLLGPLCPVETEASPCPDRPVEGAEVRAVAGGEVVATAVSDADGRFALAVRAGRYALLVEPPEGVGMSVKPLEDVTVRAGEEVEVDLLVDTGIR